MTLSTTEPSSSVFLVSWCFFCDVVIATLQIECNQALHEGPVKKSEDAVINPKFFEFLQEVSSQPLVCFIRY